MSLLDKLNIDFRELTKAVRVLERRIAKERKEKKLKREDRVSKFSDVLSGDYKLFVSPTHSMCDECGKVLYQHLIRPYQRDFSWGDVNLCPKCLSKARKGEQLRCYDQLFPKRERTG